jgi:hypothetical protein
LSAAKGGGWPAIAVLAAAFGVVEEGLATQSLFNPDYAHQHLLSSGYIPVTMAAYAGLIIVAVVYVLAVVVTALATWAVFEYVAPPSRLITAAVVALVLIIAGLLLVRVRQPEQHSHQSGRRAPSAWAVGIAPAVAASLLLLAPRIPNDAVGKPIFLVIEAQL